MSSPKTRATLYLPEDVLNQARDAASYLAGYPAYLTLTKLAESALRTELERLKELYHDGQEFPERSAPSREAVRWRRNPFPRRTTLLPVPRRCTAVGLNLLLLCLLALAPQAANGQFSTFRRTPRIAAEPPPSVVRVTAHGAGSLSRGSGTLIGVDHEHGYVVTNWHVVEEAEGLVQVTFPDGFVSAATIVKTDKEWDLALLIIWRPAAQPMPLADEIPGPGDDLMIAGYGQGPFRAVRAAFADYVAPSPQAPFDMIEVAATARQGDSGGPIVNENGELAGVLFGTGGGRTTGSHVDRLRMFLNSGPPSSGLPAPFGTSTQFAAAPQVPTTQLGVMAYPNAPGTHQQTPGREIDLCKRTAWTKRVILFPPMSPEPWIPLHKRRICASASRHLPRLRLARACHPKTNSSRKGTPLHTSWRSSTCRTSLSRRQAKWDSSRIPQGVRCNRAVASIPCCPS